MKKLIILFAISALFFSCEKDEDMKSVKYLVSNSESGFTVIFTDENGEKQPAQAVPAASTDDEWVMTFSAEPGNVVYLAVTDTVRTSFVQVKIFVDGKVYKQGSRAKDPSIGEQNLIPVVVSGVVPFN